jgi:hypothetical protein
MGVACPFSVTNFCCTGHEKAHKFITDGEAMALYEVHELLKIERYGIMITDAKFQRIRLLETLCVQFRYVMAPKINEWMHLVSLTMTALSVEGKLACL